MSFTYKATQSQKTLKDGSRTISIRITKDRKTAYVNTGVKVADSHWNPKGNSDKANWIRSSHQMHGVFNQDILNVIQKCQKVATEEMSVDDLKAEVEGRNEDKVMFVAFARKHIEYKKSKRSPISTIGDESRIKKFELFLGGKDILINQITYEKLQDFEMFVLKSGNCQNTVAGLMRFLKTIMKEAVRSKKIKYEENPFSMYAIGTQSSVKTHLTIEEVRAIENLNPESIPWRTREMVRLAKSIFLMQFYCAGARVSDVVKMRFNDIVDGKWLYKASKTGKDMEISLDPRAIVIINDLKKQRPDQEYLFPFIENGQYTRLGIARRVIYGTHRVNLGLKIIARHLELKKPLSSHIARHTWSSILLQRNGGDIYMVSKSLNHSTIKITENYVQGLKANTVDAAINIMRDV